MSDVAIDTPDSTTVVVSDRNFDHCVCELRPTDSDNPGNGWVTLMPKAYLLGNAHPEQIANAISKSSPCKVLYTFLEIISRFEEGKRQVAFLDGEELKNLPADVGKMMRSADWFEIKDGKTTPSSVTIHSEEENE